MPTDFQSLLADGAELIEDCDNGTVRLSIAPLIDVDANVGYFRRERAIENSGFQWIEYGGIIIRRRALLDAGITAALAAGQDVTVGTTTYRIKYVTPDSTGFTLDCVNVY